MLIPEFQGGLGNILFQFASTYSFAKQNGHDFGIREIPNPPEKHSDMNYADTILKPWTGFLTKKAPTRYCVEQAGQPIPTDIFRTLDNSTVIQTRGYWQNWRYIEPVYDEILPFIQVNRGAITAFYPELEDAYFLHVRRGDYVGNAYHELNLMDYYKRSIDRIGTGIAYVVSNDIAWCEDWSLLKDVRHHFIKENDVDTLSIMSQCAKGGIGVNSSFSWWGLYLNKNRPNLIIPNRWFPHNNVYQQGYGFPEATVIEI